MHKIEKTKKITVKSYPVALVSIPIIFILIFLIATTLNPSSDFGMFDLLIFYGVIGVFIVIQKYRKATFDPQNDLCIISEASILGKKETRIKCSQINNFEIVYGRGSGVARGGTLILNTHDQKCHTIISSDIAPKNEQKIIISKKEIERFLA